jgi:hypothetical protein
MSNTVPLTLVCANRKAWLVSSKTTRNKILPAHVWFNKEMVYNFL